MPELTDGRRLDGVSIAALPKHGKPRRITIPGPVIDALEAEARPGESFQDVLTRVVWDSLRHGPGCCCQNCPWDGNHAMPHGEHTLDGPDDCTRCQLLRDNKDWMALP